MSEGVGGIAEQTVSGWLGALASNAPTPGGGAFAGLTGAAGAALISMVANLTIGKDGFEDVAERMRSMAGEADLARAAFLDLADRDAHAFDGVMVAFKMPKGSDEERATRSAAIQAGYLTAAAVPMETARKAVDLMVLAEEATSTGNPQAASDGLSAAAAFYCTALCAIANVEINAAALKDESRRGELLDEVASLRARAEQALRECLTAFQLRLAS